MVLESGHACCFRSAGGMGRTLSSLASCSRCNQPWKGEMYLGKDCLFNSQSTWWNYVKLFRDRFAFCIVLKIYLWKPWRDVVSCLVSGTLHGGSDGINTSAMLRCQRHECKKITHSFFCCIVVLLPIGSMDPINIPQYMDPMGHGKIPMFWIPADHPIFALVHSTFPRSWTSFPAAIAGVVPHPVAWVRRGDLVALKGPSWRIGQAG